MRLALGAVLLLPAPPTDEARDWLNPLLPEKPEKPGAALPAAVGLPQAAVAAVMVVGSAPLEMAVATSAARSPPTATKAFTEAAASKPAPIRAANTAEESPAEAMAAKDSLLAVRLATSAFTCAGVWPAVNAKAGTPHAKTAAMTTSFFIFFVVGVDVFDVVIWFSLNQKRSLNNSSRDLPALIQNAIPARHSSANRSYRRPGKTSRPCCARSTRATQSCP